MCHSSLSNQFLRFLLLVGLMSATIACSDESPASGSGDSGVADAFAEVDANNAPGTADSGSPAVDGNNPTADATTDPGSDTTQADADPSSDGVTRDSGTDPPQVQPVVGVWTYDQQGIQNNTCGEYATTDNDTPFRVIESRDGTFLVEQSDPGNFTCTLSGSTFTCPSRIFDTYPIPDTDAVLTLNVRIDGAVESERRLTGVQTVDVTCEGATCAAAPFVLGVTFPCAWEVPFEAEFRL